MKRLDVAKHLTNEEYKQFLETYAAHNSAMGFQDRKKYSLAHVVKVERGDNGNLHVHYEDGEWWHYTPGRTWY